MLWSTCLVPGGRHVFILYANETTMKSYVSCVIFTKICHNDIHMLCYSIEKTQILTSHICVSDNSNIYYVNCILDRLVSHYVLCGIGR